MMFDIVHQNKDLFDYLVAISQIIGALATAGALWVTYLTLKELIRQTDLANNPILKIRYRFSENMEKFSSIQNFINDVYTEGPYLDWQRIITYNLKQDLSSLSDMTLMLEITNAGESEITQIMFDHELRVQMIPSDVMNFDISWKPNQDSVELIVELGEKDSVLVPITNVKYFPKYLYSIKNLRFRDIQGKQYEGFDGPSDTGEMINETLRPLRLSENGYPSLAPPTLEPEPVEEEVLWSEESEDEWPEEDEEKFSF